MSFESLLNHFRETAILQSTSDLLEWDERTGLPLRAGDYRADQITLLAGLIHARRTDPRIGQWLDQLDDEMAAEDPHGDTAATVRCLRRDHQRACKLPADLVQAISRAVVVGQQRWEAARRDNKYAAFRPALDEILRLRREEASLLADGDSLYDALLDDYEPGARCAALRSVFADLREQLVPLVQQVSGAARTPFSQLLKRSFPVDRQRRLSRVAAERVGFDFSRGRLDETTHPFCTSLGPSDCRILTRFDEHWLPGGLFGTLHEAGHGMYDQGLRNEWFGLPPGSFASLGIHESQSRLWENLVGRSHAFWRHFYPETQQLFPEALADVSLDDFYRAINAVQSSLIRVEADEVTYNLHIIIRFELEQDLLTGDLSTRDLPDAWNEKYREYLAIQPSSDAVGVLQDVHWSAGLIGYFPTYTLGNLAASQLFEAAQQDLGDLDAMFAAGQFQPLLGWLQEKIHRHGRNYTPAELILNATGKALAADALTHHLAEKYRVVYGL